jgi:hypothetical protein
MKPWLKQVSVQAAGWFAEHEALTFILLAASAVVSIGGMLLLPWAVVQIPEDYFAHERPPRLPFENRHPVVRIVLVIVKNLLGVLLLLGGLAMSLPMVPGPGIVSIVLGLMLLDLPAKRRLERWIVRQPYVLRAMNALRVKAGKPPLRPPEETAPA